MSDRTWPGLIHLARRFLYGGVRTPKLKRVSESGTPTGQQDYAAMDQNYRWFRQDELVRRCIVLSAMFATRAAGFETELEPVGAFETVEEKEAEVEKFAYVKEYIDSLNKLVNMDQILFVSQVKRSIYGSAGWEMILESEDGPPLWLLSLQSIKLEPELSADWELKSYKYEGRSEAYETWEILYFLNLSLENDLKGLSEIEPIRDKCMARNDLFINIGEIAKTIWAPYVILQADTTGMSENEEDSFLDALIAAAKSGKSLAFNRSVEATAVKIDVNFTGLTTIIDKLEEAIRREFGTPRFLLGRPIENRATAYAELEAYIDGPITDIQNYFKRALESQWYDRWTRYILKEEGGITIGEDEELPVSVKHKWNIIRTTDVYEMAKAVTALYSSGLGILGDFPDLAFDMMGWPQDRLEERLKELEEMMEQPEPETEEEKDEDET